jgi:hypothetical protein
MIAKRIAPENRIAIGGRASGEVRRIFLVVLFAEGLDGRTAEIYQLFVQIYGVALRDPTTYQTARFIN